MVRTENYSSRNENWNQETQSQHHDRELAKNIALERSWPPCVCAKMCQKPTWGGLLPLCDTHYLSEGRRHHTSPTATPERTPPPTTPRRCDLCFLFGQRQKWAFTSQTLQKSTETLSYESGHHRVLLYCTITNSWLHPLSIDNAKNQNRFASVVKHGRIWTVILDLRIVSTRRLQCLASAMSQNKYIILSRVWNYQNVKVLKKSSHVKKIKKMDFFFFNNSIQNLQMMGPAHLEISE